MEDRALHIEQDGDKRVRIRGPLDVHHFRQAKDALEKLCGQHEKPIIDLSEVTRLDTAGALLLRDTGAKLVHAGPLTAVLHLAERVKSSAESHRKVLPAFLQELARLGEATIKTLQSGKEFADFTGQAVINLGGALRHPSRFRPAAIVQHIKAIGIDALPIIALISCVISIVIAYQGQVQLKPLGAQHYTVNLIAISVLREMGALLTAIMVAGRSGSAFAAEIGTMKVRDEVDALRALGLRPFDLLVLPRIIAMLIALPLLTFFADFMGLFGGAIVSFSLLDISTLQYLEQAREAATWKDFFVGMIKSPVFAFIIAIVGCMHGMKASGSSVSVGKETTAAVVQAIFLVLMLDGLFSIYFQKVGI